MSAVLITGMSGAGKSTVAAVLARRGLISIDADGDPLPARSVDLHGNVVLAHTLASSVTSQARTPGSQPAR